MDDDYLFLQDRDSCFPPGFMVHRYQLPGLSLTAPFAAAYVLMGAETPSPCLAVTEPVERDGRSLHGPIGMVCRASYTHLGRLLFEHAAIRCRSGIAQVCLMFVRTTFARGKP